MRLTSLQIHIKHSQAGFAGPLIAGYMLGFAVVWAFLYFMVGLIYETKESRAHGKVVEAQQAHTLTKQDIMKLGVGRYTFECSGIFFKKCREVHQQT